MSSGTMAGMGLELLGCFGHTTAPMVAPSTICRTPRLAPVDHDDGAESHVRSATPAERADVRGMHRSNRAAWDEAAERYEGSFDEAVS